MTQCRTVRAFLSGVLGLTVVLFLWGLVLAPLGR